MQDLTYRKSISGGKGITEFKEATERLAKQIEEVKTERGKMKKDMASIVKRARSNEPMPLEIAIPEYTSKADPENISTPDSSKSTPKRKAALPKMVKQLSASKRGSVELSGSRKKKEKKEFHMFSRIQERNEQILRQMQQHIMSIACAHCHTTFDFEGFLSHERQCVKGGHSPPGRNHKLKRLGSGDFGRMLDRSSIPIEDCSTEYRSNGGVTTTRLPRPSFLSGIEYPGF